MAMLDSSFDDFPLHPLLRIPPLQDPFPDPSAYSARPSPLEPNPRGDGNIDHETAKLTGRRKALAEAKPIGDPTGSNNLRPIQRNPRKRPKLHEHERIADFVQLPQPKAKAENDKPPPFRPVSVLNELHEPPPSAALFPPITPKETGEQRRHPSIVSPLGSPRREERASPSKADTVQETWASRSSKRMSQRPRRKWTQQETEQLMKGIEIYGMGKWKKILLHQEFSFQPGRTPVDLKDHFRTKSKSTDSRSKRVDIEPSSKDLHALTISGAENPSNRGRNSRSSASLSGQFPDEITPDPRVPSESSYIDIRKGIWTEAEDADLEKGYKKHGFCWTDIAQDPDLNLAQRTGPQVRDRFRTKFPELYGEDARLYPSKQRSRFNNIPRKGTWTDAEDEDLEKGYKKHGFSWTKIVKDPELNLIHKTGPQVRDRFRTKFPMLYGEDPRPSPDNGTMRKMNKRERDKSHQPAETGKARRTSDKHKTRGSPKTTAGEQNLKDKHDSIDDSAIWSENEDDLAKSNETVSPSKPSAYSSGAHNIMGLLNSDVVDDRPSSPLRLDGWDENVTLPPLLWEEMATRPMFDLE